MMAGRGAQTVALRVSTAVAGALTDAAWRGELVAMYRTAVALRVGDRLVTVARRAAGGLPDGVSVDDSFDPVALGWHLGDEIAVDARAAERWSPGLPVIRVGAPGLRIRAATLARASEGLLRDRPTFASDRRQRSAVDRLRPALLADEPATADAGAELIGLGPGLTPSGDDILVGLLASLRALGDPRAEVLGAAWAGLAPDRTTPVAAAFLRHAAAGEFAERLHDLLRAALAGPTAGVEGAARTCARWGATSGVDTLVGVSLGLEAAASGTGIAAAEQAA